MFSQNQQDIKPQVSVEYLKSDIFEQYKIITPVVKNNLPVREYKLHLNLTSSSYESHGAIVKDKLLAYLQSENNKVFDIVKRVLLKEFSAQKASLHKSIKELSTAKTKSNLSAKTIHLPINTVHSVLRFNNAEQFTLYLKPNVAIKDIVTFIIDFELFLEQHNISAGQSPEFEWPLTRYFSLRKDRVNGKYIDIYKPEYYAGFFKSPRADAFYMHLTAHLNRSKLKIFDDSICHLRLEEREIHYDLLMLAAVENAQTETNDRPTVYSQLFLAGALLSLSSEINNEAQSKKRSREDSSLVTLTR